MATPYREIAAVAPPVEMVEAATCQWCRWSEDFSRFCTNPLYRGFSGGSETYRINPSGGCPVFSASMRTRMLRLVGARSPAMVDPRDIRENR